eukprot:comp16843_c0_seq1/m.15291 comp16843_c0_seq1/g.15291  ORF comp16843_c0_seq1/g.15291 comp16843_c0_seq1/m.15291 type:complete len:495 (-) comp16843_c0_seq1:298-1782(-)
MPPAPQTEGEAAHGYEYDLVVIGGGSGGLATSKEAKLLGKKVAVLDYVVPSPPGTTWGLGGTCVNVGCIPKKLMHTAAIIGHTFEDAPDYGWQTEKPAHDWSKLVQSVQDHIGSLNWGYRVSLREKGVEYLNMLGSFVDAHTIKCVDKKGKERLITTDKVLIAVGGRPIYPGIPGAKEHGITSDDLFSLPTNPGTTVVVGASYVALECAGFLASLGNKVTVLMRSIPLRGFDQQMAEMVASYMQQHGVDFVRGVVPTEITKSDDGMLHVAYSGNDQKGTLDCNTVLFAIGRTPCTAQLNLSAAGVSVDAKTGKIPVVHEQTNIPSIYAIGDVLLGRPELTPVAIQAGRLLARRLYGGAATTMDYDNIPTTIFTPLEYGCIGLAEEDATAKYGADNIEVFHSYFKPLEWTVAHREDNACYAKLVCDKSRDLRVVGLHVLGPNAGEITQGYGVAMRLGARKEDFDLTVGIHPTNSEVFTTLDVSKSSGAAIENAGC